MNDFRPEARIVAGGLKDLGDGIGAGIRDGLTAIAAALAPKPPSEPVFNPPTGKWADQ